MAAFTEKVPRLHFPSLAAPFDNEFRNDLKAGAKWTAVGTAIFSADWALLGQIARPLTSRPEIVLDEPAYAIEPGWLERNIDMKSIHYNEEGLVNLFREGIFNNEGVLEVTKKVFAHFQKAEQAKRRVGLGEAFAFALAQSHDVLQDIIEKKTQESIADKRQQGNDYSKRVSVVDPRVRDEQLDIEVVHMALYALSGVALGTKWSSEDLKRLGLSMDGYDSVDSRLWDTQRGLGTTTFPISFGEKGELAQSIDRVRTDNGMEPLLSGQDHFRHIVMIAFVKFMHRYSDEFRLPYHRAYPNFVRWEVARRTQYDTNGDEARALAEMVGDLYEDFTTITDFVDELGERWRGEYDPEKPRPSGRRDPGYQNDQTANKFGAIVGQALWEFARSNISLTHLTAELDQERFTHAETSPRLDSSGLVFPRYTRRDFITVFLDK